MSTDQRGRLGAAMALWQPGQRFPFVCCHMNKCNPDSIRVYRTCERFLRHVCEIHLPLMIEWDCLVLSCNCVFDRRIEVVHHAVKPQYMLSHKTTLEQFTT